MSASLIEKLWSRISESSSKISQALATIKHGKKLFLMKQFLRKVLSLNFDFLSTEFQVQNTNA